MFLDCNLTLLSTEATFYLAVHNIYGLDSDQEKFPQQSTVMLMIRLAELMLTKL